MRGCILTSTNYLFYTTPTAPYDIRYSVVMQQTNRITVTTSNNGTVTNTVMDGTLNPWDMHPTNASRQTKATWTFGVDSVGGTNAAQRNLIKTYEP